MTNADSPVLNDMFTDDVLSHTCIDMLAGDSCSSHEGHLGEQVMHVSG